MKICYVDAEHRAVADLVPGTLRNGTPSWTLTRINVPRPHRGQGVGSVLLKQI